MAHLLAGLAAQVHKSILGGKKIFLQRRSSNLSSLKTFRCERLEGVPRAASSKERRLNKEFAV